MSKKDETTPGPGMYSNISVNSIEAGTKSIMSSKSKSKYHFGVSREQNDKLIEHGQEKSFYGKHGDPGAYHMPEVIGANNSFKNSRLSFSKNDRGLLPLDGNQSILKSKIYNNSHS